MRIAVGGEDVIIALRALAPVTFVDGNNDASDGFDVVRVSVGDCRVLLTHILPRPDDPAKGVVVSLRREPADVVVFGHSHIPCDERVNGVWYFNPGSAGPRRFDYPVSVGTIERAEGGWRGTHIGLDERSERALERSFRTT